MARTLEEIAAALTMQKAVAEEVSEFYIQLKKLLGHSFEKVEDITDPDLLELVKKLIALMPESDEQAERAPRRVPNAEEGLVPSLQLACRLLHFTLRKSSKDVNYRTAFANFRGEAEPEKIQTDDGKIIPVKGELSTTLHALLRVSLRALYAALLDDHPLPATVDEEDATYVREHKSEALDLLVTWKLRPRSS